MAVSKVLPLYQTLDKAIKYICNYDKTEDGTLISAYKCTERFADYEFRDVADKARKVKNARIGYHAMVSFSPEDNITPQKALELGKEIFNKYTNGNYQYVLSVHTDQDHIHVHCIFNSVNYNDFKKFHIKDKDLIRLEKITDKVCKENNLSVIEKKSGVKGRGKYEYEKHKEHNSWKDKLRDAIDRNILLADSYDDFINRMQYEEGYKIKQGKYLSFTLEHEGQEHATRNRSLGDFYSIDSIKYRIENKEKYLNPEIREDKDTSERSGNLSTHKIKKLIDISKNEKAQANTAYRKKLNMINVNTYAGMINFTKKYHLVYADDFEKIKSEFESRHSELTEKMKSIYSELNSCEADAGQFSKYLENASAHVRYSTTQDKDEKYQLSDANKNFESALYYFKKNNIKLETVTEENLNQKLKKIHELRKQLERLKAERKEVQSDIRQLAIIQENNAQILGNDFKMHPDKKGLNSSAQIEK